MKYQIAPFIIPGLVSGACLFTYDMFFSNYSKGKMQSLYDAALLTISHTAVNYISEMIPSASGYSSYLDNIKDMILVPTLSGLLYSYMYSKFFVPAYDGYGVRLNNVENIMIGTGSTFISQLISDSLVNMIV